VPLVMVGSIVPFHSMYFFPKYGTRHSGITIRPSASCDDE